MKKIIIFLSLFSFSSFSDDSDIHRIKREIEILERDATKLEVSKYSKVYQRMLISYLDGAKQFINLIEEDNCQKSFLDE